LCYKRYMRKWMRERLKRRKKPSETQSGESGPAPLQPAYFEAKEAAAAEPGVEPPEAEADAPAAPETVDPPEIHHTAESPSAEEAADASAASPPTRRRRRSRGGRGRGAARPVQASPVASPSPASAELAVAPPEPPPAEIAPIPVAPPRPPKGTVILAIGLPGSGKSSWFKRHNITPLSSDMLRMLLFDNAQEQRFQDLIFSNLRSMLRARLIARRPLNYVDATNLTPHERHSWIKLAKDYGYEVQAVFFDVPAEVCLERNRRRERKVDEEVMQRMAGKLKPPTFEEGFSKITVVRVKKKEAEAS
jgi:predicted kinase